MNPYATYTRTFQKKIVVNVWAAIIGNNLVGPYFAPSRLNSAWYRDFLEEKMNEFFESVPLNLRTDTYFQQDGCPPHSANVVTDYLNGRFPGRWLGLKGPIEWSPRSPDMTPLDFFLWGTLKGLIYDGRPAVETVEELRERIEIAFDIIRARENEGIVGNASRSVLTRAYECVAQDGRQFEHLRQ